MRTHHACLIAILMVAIIKSRRAPVLPSHTYRPPIEPVFLALTDERRNRRIKALKDNAFVTALMGLAGNAKHILAMLDKQAELDKH